MELRPLGHSGLQVSVIGLGAMSLKAADERDAIALIHRALDDGANLVDTADMYEQGLNERLVGRALQGRRDKTILATKVGNQWRADGSGMDWNPRKAYIMNAVEDSLRRLNTDRIDLYQLHGGTIEDPIDETIDAFETLRTQGKILHYGISSIRPNVIREWASRSNMVSVMMQYSLADRRPEESVMQLLQEKGIGLLVRGALAQGMLVDKTPKEYLGYAAADMAKLQACIKAASHSQRSPAQTALRFVMQHPVVSSIVTGSSTMDQWDDSVAALQTPALQKADIEALGSALHPNYYLEHR